jgi:hypothetical protein
LGSACSLTLQSTAGCIGLHFIGQIDFLIAEEAG